MEINIIPSEVVSDITNNSELASAPGSNDTSRLITSRWRILFVQNLVSNSWKCAMSVILTSNNIFSGRILAPSVSVDLRIRQLNVPVMYILSYDPNIVSIQCLRNPPSIVLLTQSVGKYGNCSPLLSIGNTLIMRESSNFCSMYCIP